ncbi:hypothetical protein JB92DRAFT_2828572 [Gautieria morchelliformis]|nr:hypothetical protein JB92DRAFT_2828572 [Gautieria morchelliformis]
MEFDLTTDLEEEEQEEEEELLQCLAYMAFPRGTARVDKKLKAPLKQGDILPRNLLRRTECMALDRQLLSYRQMAEWGMRALQGGFGRLRVPLTVHPKRRLLLLHVVVRTYNVHIRCIGLNQIWAVYCDIWRRAEGDAIWEGFASMMFGELRRHDRVSWFHIGVEEHEGALRKASKRAMHVGVWQRGAYSFGHGHEHGHDVIGSLCEVGYLLLLARTAREDGELVVVVVGTRRAVVAVAGVALRGRLVHARERAVRELRQGAACLVPQMPQDRLGWCYAYDGLGGASARRARSSSFIADADSWHAGLRVMIEPNTICSIITQVSAQHPAKNTTRKKKEKKCQAHCTCCFVQRGRVKCGPALPRCALVLVAWYLLAFAGLLYLHRTFFAQSKEPAGEQVCDIRICDVPQRVPHRCRHARRDRAPPGARREAVVPLVKSVLHRRGVGVMLGVHLLRGVGAGRRMSWTYCVNAKTESEYRSGVSGEEGFGSRMGSARDDMVKYEMVRVGAEVHQVS